MTVREGADIGADLAHGFFLEGRMLKTIAAVVILLSIVAGLWAALEGSAAVYALSQVDYDVTLAGVGLVISGLFLTISVGAFCEAVQLWRKK